MTMVQPLPDSNGFQGLLLGYRKLDPLRRAKERRQHQKEVRCQNSILRGEFESRNPEKQSSAHDGMIWKWKSGRNEHLEEMRKKLRFLLVPPARLSLSLWAWNEEMRVRDWKVGKGVKWDWGWHRKVAQNLEAWNILVIYLEQRNAALSDKRANQGPTSAVGDKTPPPPPALQARQHRHRKSSQSTCWNYFKLKSQPQNYFPLVPLSYSLVGFWEFVFYNLKPPRVFSLQFSASNTVRSSQNTHWTGFKYLWHSVIVAINLYLLFKQLHNSVPCFTTQPLAFHTHSIFSLIKHQAKLSFKALFCNTLCCSSCLDVCNSKEYCNRWGAWKSSGLQDCFVQWHDSIF